MNQLKTVAFYTLGCKLNFSETSTIARSFLEVGFSKVSFEDYADIYVINTCSVTENADKRFKQIVKKVNKINSNSYIIAIGCYAHPKRHRYLLSATDQLPPQSSPDHRHYNVASLGTGLQPSVYLE